MRRAPTHRKTLGYIATRGTRCGRHDRYGNHIISFGGSRTRSSGLHPLPRLKQQSNGSAPAGLVRSADTTAAVPVIVFVKE
jgi:hypothetical protein